MALKKKEQNGHTYFELHISCPVCHDKGVLTPQSFWTHSSCGGTIYLGDDAFYWCDTCNHKSHVSQWKYGCPTHSPDAEYEYISISSTTMAIVIATAGMMVSETGVAWLQAFLANMKEY